MTRDEQRKVIVNRLGLWVRRRADDAWSQDDFIEDWIFGACQVAVSLGLMSIYEAEEWDERAKGARKGYRHE